MGALSNILGFSFLTLISRVFGLVRDSFIFSVFGTGELNSAFLLAFSIPNLFRRLLGEGALTSALLPVFASEYQRNGKGKAFQLLDKILSRLMVILFFFVGMGIFFCLLILHSGLLSLRWRLCFSFTAILLPYMFFVCSAALLAAVLNVFGKFFLHSSNAIWLNLAMIVALIIGNFFPKTWHIYLLCGGVLVGGMLQMLILWYGLVRLGWKFHFDLGRDGNVDNVQRLFFPGVAGAATVQINVVVSRGLAYFASENAVALLYLANRLVEIPMGLFVTAIATVIFPRLSNFEAKEESLLLAKEFKRGIFLTLMIVFPAMVGIFSLDRTILELLFHWRNFTERDMGLLLPILRLFLLALPFYALSTFLIRGYHCKKNTRTPMVIALVHFFINTILTLGLMFYWKSVGIALANLLVAVIQTVLLHRGLQRRYEEFRFKIWTKHLWNMLLASVAMGLVVWNLDHVLRPYGPPKVHSLISLGINIPLGVALYFGLLYILEGRKPLRDWDQLRKQWRERIGKNIT
ncbi:MAG: murein biosynthesis integral membrane protein MurJ [Puniceicoccales bacterium]|nr:murein biosynthesis integral membrane protein MurJ [Puniceicoccales bacterium]